MANSEKWGLQRWLGEQPRSTFCEEDPRIDASTHCVPCSCESCRKSAAIWLGLGKDKITQQEKIATLKEKEQL